MRILLTGFEPFGESVVNPSQEVVRAINERYSEIESSVETELATAVLPVDLIEGPRKMRNLLNEHEPNAVICMGEARGRSVISVEHLATNVVESAVPDNAGRTAERQPVIAGAPAAYFSTLNVQAIVDGIRTSGIGAEYSHDAGTCLCNQVLFTALHQFAQQGLETHPVGFLHLPWLPEQVAAHQRSSDKPRSIASMSLELMTCAVIVALETTKREFESSTESARSNLDEPTPQVG